MAKLRIMIACRPSELETDVNAFLLDRIFVSGNFQRNVFYPREKKKFGDCLQETFTAFIVYDDL